MSRKKLAEEDKKAHLSITIDRGIDDVLKNFSEEKKISKSQTIELILKKYFIEINKYTELI